MILFFHFICLLARYIVSNITKSLSTRKLYWDDESANEKHFSDYLNEKRTLGKYPVYEDDTLKFFPPVYIQRYETVALILEDAIEKYNIKKVVDFGCSELGFVVYLKNMEGVTEILEIDVDTEILERFSYKAAPLTSDYLMGKWKKALDIYILAGSIADYDDHLIGCDALVGIELIEHLTEEDFEKMPYNVFYKIRPKIAIFTTPNAEFNSLFPNFSNFRHKDHKFEWTRKEFYDWTQLVLKLYPEYSVRFYGIGAGPEGTENLGCCTQMAVFIRSDDAEYFVSAREESEAIHKYKVIQHYKYPIYVDNRTLEEKVIHEIQYQVAHLSTLDAFYNYENNETEIPLSLLKEYVSDLCPDDEELLIILKSSGMTLRQKGNEWFLVFSDTDSSPSDVASRCDDDWLNEEISESFFDNDLLLNDKLSWDDDPPCSENLPHFQCDGKQLDSSATTKSNNFGVVKKEFIAISEEKFKSASQSCKQFVVEQDSINLSSDNELKDVKCRKFNSLKSRIPRKNFERYDSSPGGNEEDADIAFICKPFKKISKSCSLDSCLENLNCKLFESESYSSNLITGDFNVCGSLSAEKRKHIRNGSGISLLSSSLDRGGDSGYPFSFSPPDDNLTPEQVDELFTENEMSRSTSTSLEDEVEVVHVIDQRLHHDVFIEDIPMENGDLANNNRDGEGNNVEGLIGERLVNEVAAERDPNDNLFFPEAQEFPPWLLNLGELALQPVYFPLHDIDYDEGVGDDSSGRFSPDLEDINTDF